MDNSIDTDINIMLEVKSGNVEKLGLLYERHKKKLYYYFYKSTGDKDTSEDLVQTVFFRMLKYKNKFSGYGKFTSWMYFIAHNVVIDHFRQNKKYQNVENSVYENYRDNIKIEEEYSKDEDLFRLRQAVNKLDAEKRELLALSKFKGLKYKDIAEILNCTEGNVKVKIYRAVKELKEIFFKTEVKVS